MSLIASILNETSDKYSTVEWPLFWFPDPVNFVTFTCQECCVLVVRGQGNMIGAFSIFIIPFSLLWRLQLCHHVFLTHYLNHRRINWRFQYNFTLFLQVFLSPFSFLYYWIYIILFLHFYMNKKELNTRYCIDFWGWLIPTCDNCDNIQKTSTTCREERLQLGATQLRQMSREIVQSKSGSRFFNYNLL